MQPETRAGFVALVGRPNVGKSTLLNALVGEKLSIVTARAQTTREQVIGLWTEGDVQIVFVDTPGLLEPDYKLQRAMLETALAAVGDADVVLVLLDATRPHERPTGEPLEILRRRRDVMLVAINKIDAAEEGAIGELEDWASRELGIMPMHISAADGSGLDDLRTRLVAELPLSEFFYPADDLAIQSVRFFVSELIRETVFELYEEEVPYSTVARIEEFREDRTPLYIRATVYVERDSQKAIIIGKSGAGIRELGRQARARIEAFLGSPVYLDLWVKTLAGWRNKASALQYLGYPVPREDEPRRSSKQSIKGKARG